eukprot:10887888-Ditylum_brightwellii.AAC.1
MDRLSKLLITCMSQLRSLIVSSILSLTNAFRSLTSLSIKPYKLDLPEPLLLRNKVRWLNVLLARFSKVALGCVIVAGAM